MRELSRGPVDTVSLASGAAIAVLGVLLLLDQAGSVDLGFNLLAALVAATVGALLLISGLDND